MTTTTYSTGDKVTVRHYDGISTYDVPCTVVSVTGSSITVDDGLGAYRVPAADVTLVERAEVEPHTPVAQLPAAPQYGKLDMSTPEIRVILHATAKTGGHIRRGRGDGRADTRMITAMGRRGFVDPIYKMEGSRKVVAGAIVTNLGARIARELTTPARHIAVNSLAA